MILLINLLKFVGWLLDVYTWMVIIAAVITWVNPDPDNPIVRFLRAVTEPVFSRIRKIIPTNFGGMDIAPLLLILALYFLQRVVLSSLVV
ncbi:YggT family protein [Desulfarculales bacterium]